MKITVKKHTRAGKVVRKHSRTVSSGVTRVSAVSEFAQKMNSVDVSGSSFLHSVSYNPKTKIMYAKMKTGDTYTYQGVHGELFKQFRNHKGSKGKFYNQHFKGKFDGNKF